MSVSTSSSLDQRGFTLAELNMSILLISIITVGVISVFTNFLATTTRNNTSLDMAVSSQNLLRTAAEEIRYGGGVRQENTINDPSVAGTAGEWDTSNTSFVIIIAVPALDSTDQYIIDQATGDPYLNELVYYRQGTTLYKRILAHPDAAGNTRETTCPTATPTCPADRKMAENLTSMSFTLYDQNNNTTTDSLLARSIKIDVIMSRDTFGSPLVMNNSIRTTLRNTL